MNVLTYILSASNLSIYWEVGEIIIIVLWIVIVKRYNLSGKQTAKIGFLFLFVTMLMNVLKFDIVAGAIAEFSLIFFVFSFIQSFIHFLKYENK